MNEKPIERLNYFNGQRLQAADFKLEQDYHMRVRRWLNRSLYTSGIATGLEVYKIEGKPKVRVLPGLAIDNLGREIILLEEVDFVVAGGGSAIGGACKGPYLTIRYQEEVVAQQDACCAVRTAGSACGCGGRNGCTGNGSNGASRAAWGGPARILAEPVLELNADLPHESSGKIPLACLTLSKGCIEVDIVDTGVRRYIGDASKANVRQYALEGVREVAAIPAVGAGMPVYVKSKVLFHIRGRQPNAVTLYLKARQLSPLHYTELGSHTHGLQVTGATGGPSPLLGEVQTSHAHGALGEANGTLGADKNTTAAPFSFTARRGYIGKDPDQTDGHAAFFLIEKDWGVQIGLAENASDIGQDALDWLGNKLIDLFGGGPVLAPENDSNYDKDLLGPTGGVIGGGEHGHSVSGVTAAKGIDLTHTHTLSGSGTSNPTGATNANVTVVARAGSTLEFIYDLQIAIDGTDRTADIKNQIVRSVPVNEAGVWSVLGDGSGGHPLADDAKDAVAIKLDYLPGSVMSEGEHSIEFSVGLRAGAANGGLVQFNLYVE